MVCLPDSVFYGDTNIGLKQALDTAGEWFDFYTGVPVLKSQLETGSLDWVLVAFFSTSRQLLGK